eukprot:7915687-Heterocapsa_arctica.AAC.1
MRPSSPHTSEVAMPMMPCRWRFFLMYKKCRSSKPNEGAGKPIERLVREHAGERGRQALLHADDAMPMRIFLKNIKCRSSIPHEGQQHH